MKIGIITFHRAVNYGAVLQAYALQTALNNLGFSAEIIDYRCDYIEDQYKLLTKIKSSKSIKYIIYLLIKKAYPSVIKNLKVGAFVKKYLNLSDGYDRSTVVNTNSIYDKFITGSDQVWNYNHSNFDTVYFLDFVNNSRRKFSYAASFGFAKLSKNKMDAYRKLLNDYQSISVREKSGIDIVNSLFNDKNAFISADPTFLLDKMQWEELIDCTVPINEKYILVYELIPSESLREYAYKIAQGNNCKVFCISDIIRKDNKIKYLYGVSPVEFLSLIKNAQAVCTNSFHGTAFSMNFNTPVCIELLKGDMMSLNARLLDLLEVFDAKDRIISEDLKPFEMEYRYINEKMIKIRNESICYLKRIGDNAT